VSSSMDDVEQEKPKTKSRIAREERQAELAYRTLLIRPAKLKDGMPRAVRSSLAAGEKAQQRQIRATERAVARRRREAAIPPPRATKGDVARQERRDAAEQRREQQRLARIAAGTDRATIKARNARKEAS
jgi:hypothetical protein